MEICYFKPYSGYRTYLKKRLYDEHFLLIFSNIDKPKHTVSLDFAVSRLKRIDKNIITVEDQKNINLAQKLRNEITHYEFEIEPKAAKSVYYKLYAFFVNFSHKELAVEVNDYLSTPLLSEATKIEEFCEEIYQQAIEQLKEDGFSIENLWDCPNCTWPILPVDDAGEYICPICGDLEEVYNCEECFKLLSYQDKKEWETGEYTSQTLCEECYDKRKYEQDMEAAYYWQQQNP